MRTPSRPGSHEALRSLQPGGPAGDGGIAAPRVRLEPATDREALAPLLLEADESEAVLRAYLNRGDRYRVLADGEDAGAVLLIREGDRLEVKNIALHDGRRGRGLGRATIEVVADLAREAGAAELVVGTADTSVDLHRFYRRCGFRRTSAGSGSSTPIRSRWSRTASRRTT